jgi:hypothetical protein
LQDYVQQCAKSHEVFLEDFMQDIQPTKFDMKVADETVHLTFGYEIDEEDEELLKVSGKFHKTA